MKRNLMGLIVVLGAMLMSMSASASTITLAEVGGLDKLIAFSDLGKSSPETEQAWVREVLKNDNLVFIDKLDGDTASEWNWKQVTDGGADIPGVWALAMPDRPDYFLVKTGNVQTSVYRDFLFANNANLGYAVVELAKLGIVSVTNVSKISHVSEFGGTKVSEPGSMVLLGTGLVGLIALRRNRRG